MSESWADRVGEIVTFTKSVSEADIALFALITREDHDIPEEPTPPVRQPRQPAPFALLTAFLMAAAARHLAVPEQAPFRQQRLNFATPVSTDDELTVRAEIAAYDAATHTLAIAVTCQNQEGQALADGEFILRAE